MGTLLCILASLSTACAGDEPLALETTLPPLLPPVTQPPIMPPESPVAPAVATNRWSDRSSWPDSVLPVAGADVVIPAGRTIYLDIDTPPLRTLTIDGTLEFDTLDVELTAERIQVRGLLQAGTEDEPFTKRAIITLTGEDGGSNVTTKKMLGVSDGGTLELHGEPRRGWVRLGATATAGSSDLVLETTTDWRVGDRLVIASTDFEPSHAELVEVQAISGRVVTLARPLSWTHWGTLQSFGGTTLDERAEVGLLSRNILVRGDERSAVAGFGGHIMMMTGGTAHIEGVELHRMGQRAKLARYPIHWHLMGSSPGQYARRNSIWGTYSRCVTVHGTHAVTVDGNVCYDHVGHGYFLEDGIEHDNVISNNLGMLARAPAAGQALLATDMSPATFWITNPDNSIRGNAAAGSIGFGFWVALPVHPTGPSTTQAVWPQSTPLRQFENNVAHSNGHAGLHVDDGPSPDGSSRTTYYRPRRVPSDPTSAPVVAEFKNFVAFKNRGRGVWLRGDHARVVGGVLADNQVGAVFASADSWLTDALVVGESDNRTASPNPAEWALHGFQFYDGPIGVERVTFANFSSTGGRPAGAIALQHRNPDIMHAGNYVDGLRFINANEVLFPQAPFGDGEKVSMFVDRDGSVTGRAGASVVVNTAVLVDGGCSARTEWSASVCPAPFAGLGVAIGGPLEPVITPFTIRRDDGATTVMSGYTPKYVSMNVPTKRHYQVVLPGAPPQGMRVHFTSLRQGDWIRVAIPYTHPRLTVHEQWGDYDVRIPEAASLAALEASTTAAWYYDRAAGVMHFKLVPRAGSSDGGLWTDPT